MPDFLEEHHTWRGEHKGLAFEIVKEPHPGDYEHPVWTWGYVFLPYALVVEKEDRKYLFPKAKMYQTASGRLDPVYDRPFYNRFHPWLDTFYITMPHCDHWLDFAVARFGWDYQHLFNTWAPEASEVKRDCILSIDRLKEMFKIMAYCPFCSLPGDPDTFVDPGFGKWRPIHPECEQKRAAHMQEKQDQEKEQE